MNALLSMQVIYVTRNPKDVFISSFHYYGMTSFLVEPGLQSDFLQTFLDGKGFCPCLMYSIYLIKKEELCNWMYLLCSDGWEQKKNYPDNTPCILKLFSNGLDTPRTLTLKSNISISVSKFPWKKTNIKLHKRQNMSHWYVDQHKSI